MVSMLVRLEVTVTSLAMMFEDQSLEEGDYICFIILSALDYRTGC